MPELERKTTTQRTIELPNGITLEYAEQGKDVLPVIVLPGYTDPWQSYSPVMEHLPNDLHVIALSQRGQGGSSMPLTGYRPADYATDLLHFMDLKEIERAVIVGHSMSAYAAQRFAIDHPDRVQGLVLIGTFATLKGNALVQPLYDSTFSKLTDPIGMAFVRDFVESSFTKQPPAGFVDTIARLDQQVPAHVWRTALGDLLASDHSAELGSIEPPTLIIWGEGDPLTSVAEQEALVNMIPGAHLNIYAGCGHSPHWDEPARFAKELADFVEGRR